MLLKKCWWAQLPSWTTTELKVCAQCTILSEWLRPSHGEGTARTPSQEVVQLGGQHPGGGAPMFLIALVVLVGRGCEFRFHYLSSLGESYRLSKLMRLCVCGRVSEWLWMGCQSNGSFALCDVKLFECYWSCTQPGKWRLFQYTPDLRLVCSGPALGS